ncbi:hypothetical protein ACSBR2_036194 [Camellia fascicularis]
MQNVKKVSVAGSGAGFGSGKSPSAGVMVNPFTAKAFLIRYWNKQISNTLPKPWFLLNKASPLTAVESATFSKLAHQNALSTRLHSFCSSANLLCYPDLSASLKDHDKNVNFTSYLNQNFSDYGKSRVGGVDSFMNYSGNDNVIFDSFDKYSHDSTGHDDKFANYANSTNVPEQTFKSYGADATSGAGDFKAYNKFVNELNLDFESYSNGANSRGQPFGSYSDETNSGNQSFSSYGKNGNRSVNGFNSYGNDSNVIGSSFNGYGESGKGANDSFTSYGSNGNVPENNFKNYGQGGKSAIDSFSSYRNQSNVGDDSFESYDKDSKAGKVNFVNYGKSFNEGTDKFTEYGKGKSGNTIGFKTYGVNNTFKDYAKQGVSFAGYINESSENLSSVMESGKAVNRRVEPGKFFRERMLKIEIGEILFPRCALRYYVHKDKKMCGNKISPETVMPMPNIRDKMPKRSFLPRVISSKLPFSSSKLSHMREIFHANKNSSMESILADTLSECERAPSHGKTKRCVGSAEDLIDFAISALGRNVVVGTTQNTNGSKQDVMIGLVKGINGGKVTKSVSCHQSLFPYLLYYYHSVPKVRVYEADILYPKTKVKINNGVAICHVDTSDWSAGRGAFLALGSGPGKIEICHWIFENDMTWSTAD